MYFITICKKKCYCSVNTRSGENNMPLGSSKIAVNKNNTYSGSGTGLIPVVTITETISNASVSSIDYRTITYDITSNRPDTRFSYIMEGNIAGSDFTDGAIIADFTTNANGNAQIVKNVTTTGGDNLDFQLTVTNGIFPGNTTLATGNINIIYSVEYPDITGGTVETVNLGNLYLDGNYHTFSGNDTLTINSTGTLTTSVFKSFIGYNDSNSYYYNNLFRVFALGGGGGSANIPDGSGGFVAAGGGGGGTWSVSATDADNLSNISYTANVGAGGLSVSVIDTPGGSGGNTVIFGGTGFEISKPGGTGGTGGSSANGGNSSLFVGGSGVQTANLNYNAGGGGGGLGKEGQDGQVLGAVTPRGGGTQAAGTGEPDFGKGTSIASNERADYAGLLIYGIYGQGGGGSATRGDGPAYGGIMYGGFDRVGGNGRPGLYLSQPSNGADGTGGGCGGGMDKGGDGLLQIRYPAGTDFRFISNVDLS
jgi:hypothetical protein